MSIVRTLSKSVIAHIAAGQVVERPASVVKELIENSIDAQAKNIIIRIEDGGKTKIVIQDDGIGMSQEDLLLAVQPHTTSKISEVADLHTIRSFGFRGEALASIGNAGRLTLQSRSGREKVGTKIIVESGDVVTDVPAGMSVGTSVTLQNIFSTLPARKKFLKSAQVEFQYIVDVVTQLAVAHPNIGFQLFHNDSLICDYLPTKFEERVRAIFGEKLNELFLPIDIAVSDYKIYGFLGSPQAAASVSQRQILLVNKRPVQSLPISKVIKRTFGSLLPPAIHPPFIINIDLDPHVIDVNIHPQKERVAFSEQELLLEFLRNSVQKILVDANLLFEFNSQSEGYLLRDSGMDEASAEILRESTPAWNVKNYFADEPILQVKKLYLVAQTQDGLILIDQHAAHERILYEEFLAAFTKENKNTVVLEKPTELSLPILEAEILDTHMENFTNFGFDIKKIKSTTYQVIAVPKLLVQRPLAEYFSEVLTDMYAGVPIEGVDYQSHRTIAYLACRTAIKAGEVLTQEERKNLLTKLLATTSKYTCPHGRPVMVHMQMKELAQIFHRIPASRNEK